MKVSQNNSIHILMFEKNITSSQGRQAILKFWDRIDGLLTNLANSKLRKC